MSFMRSRMGCWGNTRRLSVTVGAGGQTVDLGQTGVEAGAVWEVQLLADWGAEPFGFGVFYGERSLALGLEYLEYSKLFPNDVNYTVGKSDWKKDWFIYEVPHADLG